METKLRKLPLPYHVYLFDDQQPITNPKPMWLLVARTNERCDAEEYCRNHMKAHSYIKAMKIILPDGEELGFTQAC